VVYAYGMKSGAGQPSAGQVGNSPSWQFGAGALQTVYIDLKDPIDRVRGTPLRFKIVYCTTVAAGGVIAFVLEYNVAGEGSNLAPAVMPIMYEFDAGPAAVNLQKTTAGTMYIWSGSIDQLKHPDKSVDMQIELGRDGTHAGDTCLGTVQLLKLVCEYTAYT